MIQLTEEEARKLLNNIFADQDDTIKYWKERDWIKKSKLEEAREYAENIIRNKEYDDYIISFMRDKYEEAIKEILEDKK